MHPSPQKIIEAHQRWLNDIAAGDDTARAATRLALQGFVQAVNKIGHGLQGMGYPVDQWITPCGPDLAQQVAATERALGIHVPTVLVEFWRVVGALSLIDLGEYAHVAFWEDQGVKADYCDGVHIDGWVDDFDDYLSDDHEEWLDGRQDNDDEMYVIPLAPDGYHKDNISGGSPLGVSIGGSDWTPEWCNFSWGPQRPESAPAESLDFMGYLRTALLECAGFPGLYGDPAFEPVRQKLLQEVQVF